MRPFVHRAVVLQGRWLLSTRCIWTTGRCRGALGFVLTPLQLSGGALGWCWCSGMGGAQFSDRTQLPSVTTPVDAEGCAFKGRGPVAPSRLYEFQGGDSAQGSSRIRQNLDLAAFRTETGLALAPLTVLQTGPVGDAGDGLLRDWPVVGAGVENTTVTHFNGSGLCGLIALLYVWFQIVRRFIRPRSQPVA